MIKPILSFALTALLLPGLAKADIINIDYTGYVSAIEGTGLGYSLGDSVHGTVKIDLSKSAGFNVISDTARSYYAPADEHDLITGFHSQTRGNSADFLEIYDSAYEHNGGYEDFLKVSDSDSVFILNPDFSFDSKFYSFYVELLFPGINWLDINNLSATTFSSADSSALLSSRAQIYNVFAIGTVENTNVIADVAHVRFESLTVSAVSVPETNSAWLLLLSIVGLLVKRLSVRSMRN
jgi:hypothetical protein